ncbi:hypothetical protein GQ53DRAFT_263878 [Thozetella sp. PMI_491]|nr:hypothetical protein GQ53DRAFT_263878 [Thozetella sp. PMI_491]
MTFDFSHSPPVLRLDGFSLCGEDWQIEGFPFIDNDDLWGMYHPNPRGWGTSDQAELDGPGSWFSRGKPFFAAQLRYRGVECPPWMTAETACQMLKDALDVGVGAEMASPLAKIDRSMRVLYKPVYEEWKAQRDALKTKPPTPAMPLTPESIRVKYEIISLDGYESSVELEEEEELEEAEESNEESGEELSGSEVASTIGSEEDAVDASAQSESCSETSSDAELDSSKSITWDAETLAEDCEAWAEADTAGEQASASITRFLEHYFFTDGEIDPHKTPDPLVLRGFSDILALDEQIVELDIEGLETTFAADDGANSVCIGWGKDAVREFANALCQKDTHQHQQSGQPRSALEELMPLHRECVQQTPGTRRSLSGFSATVNLAGQYVVQCDEAAKWMAARGMATCDALRLTISASKAAGQSHLIYHLGPFIGSYVLHATPRTDRAPSTSTSSDGDEEEVYTPRSSRKRKASTREHLAAPSSKHAKLSMSSGLRYTICNLDLDSALAQDELPMDLGCLEFEDNRGLTFKGSMYIHTIGKTLEIEGYKTHRA